MYLYSVKFRNIQFKIKIFTICVTIFRNYHLFIKFFLINLIYNLYCRQCAMIQKYELYLRRDNFTSKLTFPTLRS